MATIKSYTDISQSKKLAEILPLESADMFYIAGKGKPIFIGNKMVAYGDDDYDALGEPDVLCWSLAALLGVLPNGIVMNKDSQNGKYHFSSMYIKTYVTADNPVDACVAMIEKLHGLNLL